MFYILKYNKLKTLNLPYDENINPDLSKPLKTSLNL